MTSRERVRAMFRGELKDGFCMSIGGMANDNMSAYAYAKLLRYLGMDRPLYIYDILQLIWHIFLALDLILYLKLQCFF